MKVAIELMPQELNIEPYDNYIIGDGALVSNLSSQLAQKELESILLV